MLDTLRDPVWQFIGVILALLSIGAAFWIYWLQRQTKELAFGLVSLRRPLAIADELSSRVTVHLDGNPVGNLHLMVYGLRNSGHRAVAPTDFERSLSITFPHGQVVSAEISSQYPANLGGLLAVSAAQVELAPLLLNPGDQLLIQVLLSSEKPTWTVDARILDIPDFSPINTKPKLPPLHQSGIPWLAATSLGIAVGSYIYTQDVTPSFVWLGLSGLVMAMGVVSHLLQDSGRSSKRRITDA